MTDLCNCGHNWASHIRQGKLGWCSHNQVICDCWEYKSRNNERENEKQWLTHLEISDQWTR